MVDDVDQAPKCIFFRHKKKCNGHQSIKSLQTYKTHWNRRPNSHLCQDQTEISLKNPSIYLATFASLLFITKQISDYILKIFKFAFIMLLLELSQAFYE